MEEMKMKRTIGFVLLVTGVLFSGKVFAQQQDGLSFSGDVRTGVAVIWGTGIKQETKLANYDAEEPGFGSPGSIRMNFNYTRGVFQFKWRLEADAAYLGGDYFDKATGVQHKLGGFAATLGDIVKYAYAMGDFFDNQLRLSGGKFDAFSDSPWSVMGDELWTGVESFSSGIRAEYKPKFLPGLNVGFFLPVVYGKPDLYKSNTITIGSGTATNGLPVGGFPDLQNYLAEIGYGVTYTNDNFEISVSGYGDGNGDGEYDPTKPVGLDPMAGVINGEKGGVILWRVNPKIINNLVPALSIWVNGYISGLPLGVSADDLAPTSKGRTESYLYTVYKAGNLEAKLTTGLYTFSIFRPFPGVPMWLQSHDKDLLFKPRVTYNFTPLISASVEAPLRLALGFDDDFKIDGKDPKALSKLELEAKIAISLPGAILYNGVTLAGVTITPVYHFERGFAGGADAAASSYGKGGTENVDLHRFEIRFMWAF
jgi:hypothetical protein